MTGNTDRTIAAYDTIAEVYTAFWRDRRVVARPLTLLSTLLAAGDLVLDAGCGPGFDGAELRRAGLRVIGLDLSWQMLQSGQRHYPGQYVQADLRALPLPDACAAAVWASASLLHLPRAHFGPALQELTRVLLPRGLLFLSLKEGVGDGWQADACGREAPRFFTYWQAETLDAALAAAGLHTVAGWRDEGEANAWLNRIVRKR